MRLVNVMHRGLALALTWALAALTSAEVAGAAPLTQDAALETPPPASAPERAWTFLIYGGADNNADGHMFGFIQDVRAAFARFPEVELILFMDRHARYSDDASVLGEDFTGARLYRLTGGAAERLAGGKEFPEMTLDGDTEVDSGHAATLGKFLRFGLAHYPAARTGLLIYSHADGVTMCPDESEGSAMDLASLGGRLGGACAVDFTGLELCNMGSFENAYAWRPGSGSFSTEVLLAIPNAGPPLDWEAILAGFTPDMDARQLGRMAIEAGGAARRAAAAEDPGHAQDSAYEACACLDLSLVEAAKQAWDAFAVALAGVQDGARVLAELRGPGPRGHAIDYVGGHFAQAGAFVDAVDLARRAAAAEDLPEPVRAAAAAARRALDAVVLDSFAMPGYSGFVSGENGLAIACPDGLEPATGGFRAGDSVWSQCDWIGRSPFGRDGATPNDGRVSNWAELLDHWYDTEQSVGDKP